MTQGDTSPLSRKHVVSRRRLVRGSALTAGSLALAARLEEVAARVQDAAGAPITQPAAERVLTFDFPAFQVGTAAYAEGQTGCTVFLFSLEAFPNGVMLEMDVRGGDPAYLGVYGTTNAICLAGGSSYGLEAATGVASEIYAQSGFTALAAVSGAVIWDTAMDEPPDGTRDKGIYPDKALGQAAVRAAQQGVFPLGPYGVGTGATVGQWVDFPNRRESSGQGGAFRQIGPIKIAFFTVVNALGVIVDRQGQVVRGGLDPATGERAAPIVDAEQVLAGAATLARTKPVPGGLTSHTTLSVLVVNVDLPRELLRQLGRQVHSSMARGIHPFHTPDDGDVLFATSTGEIPAEGIDTTALGIVASEMAWDAILGCYAQTP